MKKSPLLCILSLFALSCSDNAGNGNRNEHIVLEISFDTKNPTKFLIGDTKQLAFTVRGNDITDLTFAATSSDAEWAATVKADKKEDSYTGTIDVIAPATPSGTTIILTVIDRRGKEWTASTAALTAVEPPTEPIELFVVLAEDNPAEFTVGESKQLAFTVTGNDLQNLTFAAIPDHDDWVASVSANEKGDAYEGVIDVTAPAEASFTNIKLAVTDRMGGEWSVVTPRLTATEPPITATNLSKDGTANCYIVSGSGEYMFDADKRGNGSGTEASITISTGMKADWLWLTKGLETEISDISLDAAGKHICFNAAGLAKGNAVIALVDASGEIVWTWHVWFTDEPAIVTYANGKQLLDRSLGATGTTTGTSDAYGLYYQWGRKDPFCGGTMTETSADAFLIAKQNSVINPTFAASHEWKQESGSFATVDYARQHPLSFLSNKLASSYDWLASGKLILWNTAKTIHDPCPAGYKVPDNDTWSDFADGDDRYIDGTSEWSGTDYGMTYLYGGHSDWYPAQGYRNRDKGNLVGLGNTRTGRFWSNHLSGNSIFYLLISKKLSSGKLLQPQSATTDSAYGFNVRCAKE